MNIFTKTLENIKKTRKKIHTQHEVPAHREAPGRGLRGVLPPALTVDDYTVTQSF